MISKKTSMFGGQSPWLVAVLRNLDEHKCTNVEYSKGILVGVVRTMMATRGYTIEAAIDAIKPSMPDRERIDPDAIPDSWKELF